MIKTFIPEGFDALAEYRHIVSELKTRFCGPGVVLGMSGGKDSSVVAKLFRDALGEERVTGLVMPNGEMRDKDIAVEICAYLGIRCSVADISGVYLRELELLSAITDPTGAALINILPRIRMTTLYAFAQSEGLRVAGTGNLSEIAVGYCTKWGDMASDFNPIAKYTCSEVIQLGRQSLPDWIIGRTPDDGLCGRADEDNLGFSYFELDRFLRTGEKSDRHGLIAKRIEGARHKREPIPCVEPLFGQSAIAQIAEL